MTAAAPVRDDDATALRGRARSIIRGAAGRLFYEDYEGASLATLAAAEPFPSAVELRWRRSLETRVRRLARRGLGLHVLVGPDAHFVYRDELPAGVTLPEQTLAGRFRDRFGDIQGLTFVDPTAALVEARGGIDVYKANDTHWSAYGAFVAYRALMAALPADHGGHIVEAREVRYRFRRSYGDMGALVEPEVIVEVPVPVVEGPSRAAVKLLFDRRGAAREGWGAWECASGRGRALVARDSFATELAPFVNATFARVDWISAQQALPFEVVDAERPDLLVWEVAERRLPFPPRDHLPFGACETHAFDPHSPAGRAGLDAVANRLDGHVGPALAAARQAVALDAGDAVSRFWLAQLLLELGRFGEAEAAVGEALALRDDRAAYWHLRNIALRHLGRRGEALDASRRAVALLPDNGLFVSHLGFNLLAAGRTGEAVETMRECRAVVSDCEELCYWLARALLAAGEREAALAAAVDCFLLQPDQTAVHALLATIRDGRGAL